jgi:hypothetical protein
MRKRFLLSLDLVIALVALGAISYAVTKPVTKTHQYRCTDRNQSLYFVVYETNGKLSNGQMYVENMQVANLTVEQAGTDVIKAKVNGNSANVAFQLFKSGKVMVANYQTNNRVEVCQASYEYK